jgi:hypothetical protein
LLREESEMRLVEIEVRVEEGVYEPLLDGIEGVTGIRSDEESRDRIHYLIEMYGCVVVAGSPSLVEVEYFSHAAGGEWVRESHRKLVDIVKRYQVEEFREEKWVPTQFLMLEDRESLPFGSLFERINREKIEKVGERVYRKIMWDRPACGEVDPSRGVQLIEVLGEVEISG